MVVAQGWGGGGWQSKACSRLQGEGQLQFCRGYRPYQCCLLAFPIGVRFLKVHEGFVLFHAPRELSVAMKEMQEVGRMTDGHETKGLYFKRKLFGGAPCVLLVTWEDLGFI